MEKNPNKFKVKATDGLLDCLYMGVDFEKQYKQAIRNEHEMSVKLSYKLNDNILKLSKLERFLPLCERVFKDIVAPIITRVKEFMKMYRIANEGEMFSTDFSFRMCDTMAYNSK